MESILVCVVVENVSVCGNLNHVLKFSVDDKVIRAGECFREMTLQAQVSLFYKLKMISWAVIWGQIKSHNHPYLSESCESFPIPKKDFIDSRLSH